MSSWKTTVGGLLAALATIFLLVSSWLKTGELPDTSVLTTAVIGLGSAIAAFFARDNKTSDEKAGAK